MDGTATDNRETLYTVAGATTSSAALDCLNNSTQVATVSGISPAADGTIQVRIEPGPNNDNSSYCLGAGAAPGNYLRLAGGFVASKSRPDHVSTSRIQVWNGDNRTWEAGVANVNYTRTKYATEEAAFAATGYSGLGGYYVYAGGDDYTPPPEPVVFIVK